MRVRPCTAALLLLLRAADGAPSEAPREARELVDAGQIITGAGDYESCLEYATCRSEGFHCFRRAGQMFAQCRPRTGTSCVEAGMWDPIKNSPHDWLCPGWEYCAHTHGNCAYSKCCQNGLDVCLSRVRRARTTPPPPPRRL